MNYRDIHNANPTPNPTRLGAPRPVQPRLSRDLAHSALTGRFRAGDKGETLGTPVPVRPDLKERRQAADSRLLRLRLGALATMAAATIGISATGGIQNVKAGVGEAADALAAKFFPTATGNTASNEDLSQLPQQPVTVQSGEGTDDVILDVSSNDQAGLFSDAADLMAVRKYIDDQHPGVLQPGERVEVPVLPPAGK